MTTPKRKKRILFVTEASFLNTGFSKMTMESLKRLHATGKYVIAEAGNFGSPSDAKALNLPWIYYGNGPSNANEENEYANKPFMQFGDHRYEDILLDFKPDIVVSWLDPWMTLAQVNSSFRKCYNLILMPTVDGYPQQEDWIDVYTKSDAIYTYTKFGERTLKRQTGDFLNILGVNSPGVDTSVFKPIANRQSFKHPANQNKEMFIVGTVMRNQRRKLYPDLIQAFKLFLDYCADHNPVLGDKTYLYLHTSYPDVGWDIPRLVAESDIGHKMLFTYVCHKCGHVFPSIFQDAMTTCMQCGEFAAGFTNTKVGVSEQILANIINTFDAYVQYSVSEGFGVPIVEAAACGVPVFCTDYSAMEDFPETLGATPIKIARHYREADTHRYMAYPDNEDFAMKLYKFLSLPEGLRRKKGFQARLGVEKHYTWDKHVKKWMDYFDSEQSSVVKASWDSPPTFYDPTMKFPSDGSNEDFVKILFRNVLGNESLASSFLGTRILRDLNYGMRVSHHGGLAMNDLTFLGARQQFLPYQRQQAVEEVSQQVEANNYWERVRCGIEPRERPEFLKIADKVNAGKDKEGIIS